MRDIKFRAWDKKRKRMGWVESLAFNYKNDLNGDDWLCYSTDDMEIKERPCGDYREKENVILMQYTGLKDKNDKEIYEGDIIKESEYFKCYYKVEYDKCSGRFVGFKIGDRDNNTLEFPQLSEDGEVVGNIYECIV
ncbi:YopX family protein [Clostridium sp. 001]|uniref:YopX family protein n=1 Tax=Clostridium sp. 001 TaxID=1970093 RepID=UPI001C2CAF28|nr:YopX family protein [Clostridium sp. 001]QXE19519.1 hypothetical protein B5S50_12190 [Clostridium sp. 001]